MDEQADTCATKKHKSKSNKTRILKTKESANSQDHTAEDDIDNEIKPQGRKTRVFQRKSQKESKDCKLLPSDGSVKEENVEEEKKCTTEKANSQANKRKSKRGKRN